MKNFWDRYSNLILILIFIFGCNLAYTFLSNKWNWITITALILLVGIIKYSKFGLSDLGLDKKQIKPGFVWGSISSLIILVMMVTIFVINPEIFQDERSRDSLIKTLFTAFFAIPLGTVLIEELIFRGVLYRSIEKLKNSIYAVILSSIIFGLWHISSSRSIADSNNSLSITGVPSNVEFFGIIFGTVVGTFIAGLFFAELRRRSGSIIAPMLAHWVINATGVILVFAAWA